jgi:hypothetical protein
MPELEKQEETPEQEAADPADPMKEEIYEKIAQICEEKGIKHACFLAVHPESREPVMYFKGDRLVVARVTALFTRIVKDDINQELAT